MRDLACAMKVHMELMRESEYLELAMEGGATSHPAYATEQERWNYAYV
jgi:hypothetical protein